jgi:hypothetical protein
MELRHGNGNVHCNREKTMRSTLSFKGREVRGRATIVVTCVLSVSRALQQLIQQQKQQG